MGETLWWGMKSSKHGGRSHCFVIFMNHFAYTLSSHAPSLTLTRSTSRVFLNTKCQVSKNWPKMNTSKKMRNLIFNKENWISPAETELKSRYFPRACNKAWAWPALWIQNCDTLPDSRPVKTGVRNKEHFHPKLQCDQSPHAPVVVTSLLWWISPSVSQNKLFLKLFFSEILSQT